MSPPGAVSASAVVPVAARRARVAAGAGFAAQGLVYALLLTSLDGFKERYGVDDGQVTLVVLGVCVMAALGTVMADRVARSAGGSRAALVTGLLAVALAALVAAVAPAFGVLVLGFVVYGLGLGLVDAGTNMQAVAVQRVYGRSLLTGFYAAWSAAGIVGALLVSVGAQRWPARPVAVVLLAGPVVALVAAGAVLRGGWRAGTAPVEVVIGGVGPSGPTGPVAPGGVTDARAQRAVPWGPVLVLGVGVVAYYVADTAVSTWSTIYLGDVLLSSASFAPLGYAAYLATTLASRLAGDRCVRRWGRAAVVRVAALVGAVGLLLVVVAPAPVPALLGMAVTGAGLGVVAPLCFSAAGALAPGRSDVVVARLNVFNYVGAVLGGVLVGAIGSTSTLRAGFAVPAVLALAVVAVAGRFALGEQARGRPVRDDAPSPAG